MLDTNRRLLNGRKTYQKKSWIKLMVSPTMLELRPMVCTSGVFVVGCWERVLDQ